MPSTELVVEVLDDQVRRANDDGRADDDDDDVDAVDEKPAREQAGIPARLAGAETGQRDRDGGERRDTVGKQRERANELPGPRLHRRAVFTAGDVEGAQQPA